MDDYCFLVVFWVRTIRHDRIEAIPLRRHLARVNRKLRVSCTIGCSDNGLGGKIGYVVPKRRFKQCGVASFPSDG